MSNYEMGYDPFGFGGDNNFSNSESYESTGPYIPPASDCRSCGMCLSNCPTYKITFDENNAPRGRIRLIDRVINKDEELTKEERDALEACTQCRACETVCPSKMAYGELYALASDKLAEKKPHQHSLVIRLLLRHFSTQRWLQNISGTLIQLYQGSGLQWLARKSKLLKGDLKQLDKLLPPNHSSQTVPYFSRALTEGRIGKVALFSGCLSNTFDTQTHNDTIKVLTRLGYEVFVPKSQTCCGAMHAHSGERETAIALARQNIEAFSESRVNAVVFNSSGCGSFLSEYEKLLELDDDQRSPKLIRSIMDVMSFLETIEWPSSPTFRISRLKVAVHEPCTQRNHLKNQDAIYRLLKKIPGLEVISLPENNICCGAGGTKMITQPEMAEPLRDIKVKALLESEADILLSSNMSCAMHLASGIREAGKEIEVLHPIQLLARQLI